MQESGIFMSQSRNKKDSNTTVVMYLCVYVRVFVCMYVCIYLFICITFHDKIMFRSCSVDRNIVLEEKGRKV